MFFYGNSVNHNDEVLWIFGCMHTLKRYCIPRYTFLLKSFTFGHSHRIRAAGMLQSPPVKIDTSEGCVWWVYGRRMTASSCDNGAHTLTPTTPNYSCELALIWHDSGSDMGCPASERSVTMGTPAKEPPSSRRHFCSFQWHHRSISAPLMEKSFTIRDVQILSPVACLDYVESNKGVEVLTNRFGLVGISCCNVFNTTN